MQALGSCRQVVMIFTKLCTGQMTFGVLDTGLGILSFKNTSVIMSMSERGQPL